MRYTKDQLAAINAIIKDRPPYLTLDKQLMHDGHNVVINCSTLLVLEEPVWSTGTEYDVKRLFESNETRDNVIVWAVSSARTHYFKSLNYCKLAEDAFFDPKVVKRAFRALKYRGEDIALHYTVDRRTQQRYCLSMTFRTKYGFALVMACRVNDESLLTIVY